MVGTYSGLLDGGDGDVHSRSRAPWSTSSGPMKLTIALDSHLVHIFCGASTTGCACSDTRTLLGPLQRPHEVHSHSNHAVKIAYLLPIKQDKQQCDAAAAACEGAQAKAAAAKLHMELGIGLGIGLPLLITAILCFRYRARLGARIRAWRLARAEAARLRRARKVEGDLQLIGFSTPDTREMDVFLKDSNEPVELKGLLMGVLSVSANTLDHTNAKFVSELRSLITGQPQDAALGYIHYMKVEPSVVHIGLSQGIDAIRAEFERYVGDRAEEVRECMRYVLFERAGSSDKMFPNSPHKRDHTRNGETLDDFVNHPDARTARLEPAHVAALRI